MEIQFRPASLADEEIAIPLIYSSGPQTFDYVFSVDYREQSLDFLRYAYRRPQGQFSHNEHTVITADGQVVGCGCLSDSSSARSNMLSSLKQIVAFYGLIKSVEVINRGLKVERVVPPPKTGVAYISNLGAAPQGKGYGSRVIHHFIEQAQENGFQRAALDVADSNDNAHTLYKRIGFVDLEHKDADDKRKWGHLEGHTYMEKTL